MSTDLMHSGFSSTARLKLLNQQLSKLNLSLLNLLVGVLTNLEAVVILVASAAAGTK